MMQSTQVLSAQAAQLPPAERLVLIESILDGLDVPDASLETLWAKEAEERLEAYKRGELHSVPLADALAKYRISTPK
jgi:putative addiction module component (TIGR02574 family)